MLDLGIAWERITVATEATRSRENTRARLLDAAAQVFAEVGIGGASVEAICERAGFTRGAFYSNFDSKDELFLELSTSVASRRIDEVRSRVAELEADPSFSEGDDLGSLMRVLDAVGDDRLGMMLMAEIRIRAMRDAEFGKAFLEQQERLLSEIEAIIDDVVRVRRLRLRTSATEAARLMLAVWETTSVRGAIARLPEAQREAECSRAVTRAAQLVID